MSQNLVIVESPAKAKTIEKYLGPGFKVLASYGHVRDLPSKNGSVDVENDFAMNYTVPTGSQKAIKAIADAAKKADTIYLATDLDREGESISWHVLEELKKRLKKAFDGKAVHRIEFTEITKKAITSAVANPRALAMPLVDAQQARRALDYLVGFNLSPVLWRKVQGGLSAGRVQSVALRLICEREDAIEAFKPEEYWTIDGVFNTPAGDALTARLTHLKGEKLDKFSINVEASATDAVKELEAGTYSITDIQKKQTKRNPSPPFITSTLQQEASRKLGFGARKTMTLAQKLYEDGLITYMRTDSVHLANEAIQSARGAIESLYGNKYVPAKPNFFKSKSKNAQEAHEAIRPTDPARKAADIKAEVDAVKLYDLIWKRTLACQMAQALVDQTALVIADKNQNAFRATGSIIAFDGFLKVYREGRPEEAAKDGDTLLPAVNENDDMALKELKPEQHFTEPPPRYSEASLVKELEEHGIGRPSTYAAIVSTIQDRGYVRQEAKRFHPEDVGRIVNKFLTEHFAQYVDLGFTAGMEEELDAISRGEKEWKPMLREFWGPFITNVEDKMESVRKRDVTTEETDEDCPTCGEGKLLIRLGKYGRFKGCNRYPECKHIEPLNGEAETEKPQLEDTGITCPKCGEGTIVERKSRRGKTFYSCSTYPKCDQAYWDKPLEEPCPECGSPHLTLKVRKRAGDAKKCPDCNYQDPPMTEAEIKRAEAARERWAKRKKK